MYQTIQFLIFFSLSWLGLGLFINSRSTQQREKRARPGTLEARLGP